MQQGKYEVLLFDERKYVVYLKRQILPIAQVWEEYGKHIA